MISVLRRIGVVDPGSALVILRPLGGGGGGGACVDSRRLGFGDVTGGSRST